MALIYFFASIFCKSRVLNFSKLFFSIFVISLCFGKVSNNSTDSDLKFCSKFQFYSSKSIHEIVNKKKDLDYFAISKLRRKPEHFLKFYQILILLSGDISLFPGPCEIHFNDGRIWDLFKTCGLYFRHLNVNSLLPTVDELKEILNYTKPAILGIPQSKLNSYVTDTEINIDDYSIVRNDRNRNGEVAACYIRNNLCFNINNIFPNFIKNIFEILITKVKPNAIGTFYRTLNANDILDIFLNNFQQIGYKTNEFYLLRDFNINLLQNGTFILKENQSYELKNSTYAFVNKRKNFCQKLSLTEIMKESTEVTWPCLIIFSVILLSKEGDWCKSFRSSINIIQLQYLLNVNVTYSDLLNKIAPIKEIKIKNNPQE